MQTRLLLILVLLCAPVLPAEGAEPFYLDLFEKGKSAATRGNLEEAKVDLEIACFGFLDEPDLLIEGLVHQALVSEALGETTRVTELLERLLLVERRFSVYEAADLDAVRTRFEDLLYRRVDIERALEIEAFRHLGERRFAEQLAVGSPEQKRALLIERLEADPDELRFLRLLAEIELAQGLHSEALAHVDRILVQQPSDPQARCQRFEATTRLGLCEQALAETTSCPNLAAEPGIATELLTCLTAGAKWTEASMYLESLPASTRSISRLRKLERQVTKGLREQQRLVADAPVEDAPETPAEPPTDAVSSLAGAEAPAEVLSTSAARDESSESATASDSVDHGLTVEEQPTPPAVPSSSVPEGPNAITDASAPVPDPCQAFRRAARRKNCRGILADIDTCEAEMEQIQIARPTLNCLVEADEWQRATDLLEILPAHVRSNGKIRKLEKRIGRQQATAQPSAEIGSAEPSTALAPISSSGESPFATSPPSSTAIAMTSEEELDDVLEQRLTGLRQQLLAARTASELTVVLAETTSLAQDNSNVPAVQFLAAETAYRAGQWAAAALFFERGGDPGRGQPLLRFYRAIALYETGSFAAAAESLELALPHLQRTAFVDTYAIRIRAAAAGN